MRVFSFLFCRYAVSTFCLQKKKKNQWKIQSNFNATIKLYCYSDFTSFSGEQSLLKLLILPNPSISKQNISVNQKQLDCSAAEPFVECCTVNVKQKGVPCIFCKLIVTDDGLELESHQQKEQRSLPYSPLPLGSISWEKWCSSSIRTATKTEERRGVISPLPHGC